VLYSEQHGDGFLRRESRPCPCYNPHIHDKSIAESFTGSFDSNRVAFRTAEHTVFSNGGTNGLD
jgi:hypothetical protein